MYRIYFKYWYGEEFLGCGVSTASYRTAAQAEAAAKVDFYDHAGLHYECVIAAENPFTGNQGHTNNN